MEANMKRSDSYITIEKMIQRGEIVLSTVERMLAALKSEKRITPSEYNGLLDLAWRTNINSIRSLISTKNRRQ